MISRPTIFDRVAELHAMLLYCFTPLAQRWVPRVLAFAFFRGHCTTSEVSTLKENYVPGLHQLNIISFDPIQYIATRGQNLQNTKRCMNQTRRSRWTSARFTLNCERNLLAPTRNQHVHSATRGRYASKRAGVQSSRDLFFPLLTPFTHTRPRLVHK